MSEHRCDWCQQPITSSHEGAQFNNFTFHVPDCLDAYKHQTLMLKLLRKTTSSRIDRYQ